MTERYFAYGSNLCIDQMIARAGPINRGANQPRIAWLPNYRLAFNMRIETGQVFANLMSPGKGVFGVVYCCTPETLTDMDGYEEGYDRVHVLVVLESGEELHALTYLARAAHVGRDSTPSADYLQKILTGARQHGLPDDYIQEIEFAAKAQSEN